ncbi:MAG: glycoside hydrolase family 2 [Erysipelotrichaceae bacterium]|nr:glycoside hydrolase family 2 [Erysipelotrichaceae bacterium]
MIRLMKTRWSDSAAETPLPLYPRPQFQRDSYLNLNGYWKCAFTAEDRKPDSFDQDILVPFSPETLLSGVNRILKPDEYLWYKREFVLEKGFNRGRVILNFEAVDQIAEVYVNGHFTGRNEGGYYAFSFDITEYLTDVNELIVKVRDFSDTSYFERGKQKFKRGGIWYTPQSGIWQTVWLESVPKDYLKGVRITPDLFGKSLTLEFDKKNDLDVNAEISVNDIPVESVVSKENKVTVLFDDVKPWSPEDPVLYDLKLTNGEDVVKSYFAFRKFEIKVAKDNRKRFFLNGRPYYPNGLLDQGYWSDGLYTAPSDEALIHDITVCKERGFNALRKHIKLESRRWYYHCDRLGMLVFQDMINGGGTYSNYTTLISSALPVFLEDTEKNYKLFAREDARGREMYYTGLKRLVEELYNVPSLVLWTPFNEGWGQFDSKKVYDYLLTLDNTRIIEPASGWHNQHFGDINSKHLYFKAVNMKKFNDDRLYYLSEFGGYTLKLYDHCYNDKQTYGYKRIKDLESLNESLRVLFTRDILNNIDKGLAGSIYTQVSDVEDEVNGLMTYDREVTKVSKDTLLDIVAAIKEKYQNL